MNRITRVKKRDGREVPFDKAKISDAVGRAQAAVGAADPHFAAEVADVVEMALARRASQPTDLRTPVVPGIEEIQDLVEQALVELGHASVAKAYILYRDRRARLRAALEVRSERDLAASATPPADPSADRKHDRRAPPRVQVQTGIAAWSKGRIVVALMNEADLPRATAEQVAARVEERVFDSGLKRISTALIRELVDNELVELGLAQALKRQRPLLVPRHDLRRLLANDGDGASVKPSAARRELAPLGPGTTVAERLSGALLSRYALEDVLPEHVAELHQAGELDFQDLSRCHLALTQAVPAELLLTHDRSSAAAYEALEELARLCAASAYGVVVEDAQLLVQTLLRGVRGNAANAPRASGPLASFLIALSAVAQASGRSIDLLVTPVNAPSTSGSSAAAANASASSGAASASSGSVSGRASERRAANVPTWLARLLEELDELASGPERARLPRVFLDGEDLEPAAREPALRAPIERLLARGMLVPTWSVAGERFAAPGLTRAWRERGALVCGGACSINLARAARRAGPWREDALLENVARSLDVALEGLAALHEFQRRERWIDASQRGLVRARVSYAITPVGLREALRLVADGELRPEQAARLTAFLAEAVQRFSKTRGLPVTLSAWFGERAAQRFAVLDREQFLVQQPLLFSTGSTSGEREFAPSVAPYSTGFDLAPLERAATSASVLEAAEAAVCATQKSGALHPPQLLRGLVDAGADAPSGAARESAPTTAAWERLERARARLRSGAWALYALPPGRGDELSMNTATAPTDALGPALDFLSEDSSRVDELSSDAATLAAREHESDPHVSNAPALPATAAAPLPSREASPREVSPREES